MQAANENRFLRKINWRLPKLSEFRRVIGDDGKCAYENRAVSSRLSYPIGNDGKSGDFWASTTINYVSQTDERPLTKDDTSATSVDFANGGFGGDYISDWHLARLVRYGERTPVQSSDELKSTASSAHALPPEKRSGNTSGQIYFKPYSADGVPVSPPWRERSNTEKNGTFRDLGDAKVMLGVEYEVGLPISATLLFLYDHGKLELSPSEFELHAFPGERVLKPSEVRRKVYEPSSSVDIPYGEWIYLKYPVQPETVEQLALIFPSDTVSNRGSINVRPFRFEKTNGTTSSNFLETSKPINITPPTPVGDRMKSCDPQVAIAAAEEIISKQSTLKDPLLLFTAAATLFQHGKKDEAVFWFYAAQLRTRYQLVFENGDRSQLLQIMLMAIGTSINNYAFQNVGNLRRILDKVLEWDKITTNLFRDSPHSEAEEQRIASIYTGMRDFQSKIITERTDLEAKARKAAPEIERVYTAKYNPKCRADQVDPASATQETEKEKKLVSDYVQSNPEIIQDAGEIKNVWVETFSTKSTDTMPSRYEVGVVSSAGKESHAIIDVSRSGSEVKFKLHCIARKRWVLRDPTKGPCNQ